MTSTVKPKPTPYRERSLNNLLYLHRILIDRNFPVPTDLIAALQAKGVIVEDV